MGNSNEKNSFRDLIVQRIYDMKNMKLAKKLIYSYIIIIAIPTIAFSFFTLREFENNLREDTVNENRNQLKMEKVNITRNFQAMMKMAQMVTVSEEFMEYVEGAKDFNPEELVTFNQQGFQYVLKMQYSNPSIVDVNVFSNNKNVIEIWPLIYSDERVKDKGWYQKTIEAQGKWYLHLNSSINDDILNKYGVVREANEPIVAYCKEIKSSNNRNIGVIRVNMLTKIFFPKMFSENKDIEGQFFVVDKNNNIYTNENDSFLKGNSLKSDTILEDFLKYKRTDADNFSVKYDKKDMIVVYTSIDELGLEIFNVVSIVDMIEYKNQIRNFYILGSIVLITLLSIVTYFITSIILKRLYIIIQSMKKLQQGDFNIDITVRSNDEIGELAHHFRKMLRKINELIQEAVDKRSVTKEAELRALHNQIDSHFIYNTLENIKMMAEIDGQFTIADSINSLGAMMRYNMKWNSEFSTFSEEIAHIQNYIALMNVRFDNKIDLNIYVDSGFMDHEILKMSLQPLVENSVKHGLRNMSSLKQYQICIYAFCEGEHLKVIIEDNGIGMTEEEAFKINRKISSNEKPSSADIEEAKNKKSTGIGLKNVNERVKIYYGENYGIEVFSEQNEYTKVVMTLPY